MAQAPGGNHAVVAASDHSQDSQAPVVTSHPAIKQSEELEVTIHNTDSGQVAQRISALQTQHPAMTQGRVSVLARDMNQFGAEAANPSGMSVDERLRSVAANAPSTQDGTRLQEAIGYQPPKSRSWFDGSDDSFDDET